LDEYSARLFVKMGLLVICPDITEKRVDTISESVVVTELQPVVIKEDNIENVSIGHESIEEQPIKKKRIKNENNIHQKTE